MDNFTHLARLIRSFLIDTLVHHERGTGTVDHGIMAAAVVATIAAVVLTVGSVL